jgi:ribose-phosphate pyrophosphokinase
MSIQLVNSLNLEERRVPLETFKFPGGEVHVKVPTGDWSYNIFARLNSSDDILALLLTLDTDLPINNLYCPYLPYARQDRKTSSREPFSLRVFAKMLEPYKHIPLNVLDPHSDVAAALFPQMVIMESRWWTEVSRDTGKFDPIIVSPDAGALKRTYHYCQYTAYDGEVLCASKKRNTLTGKITETRIDGEPKGGWAGRNVLIVDDIIDGGRTFIELAKVLKEKGANKVLLAASHGILSAGEEPLKVHIDHVYTTNSIKDDESDFVTRYKLNVMF